MGHRTSRGTGADLPGLAVLAGVAAGLAAVVLVGWREGTSAMAVALLLGAALRLGLPDRDSGLLVVRGRRYDGAVLLVLGFGLLLLAGSVPGA